MIWPKGTKRWVILLPLLSFLLMIVIGIVVGVLDVVFETNYINGESILFFLEFGVVVLIFLFMKWKGLWRVKRLPSIKEWFNLTKWWMVGLVGFIILETVATNFFHLEYGENQALIEDSFTDAFWLTSISVALFTPIMEEFFFRRSLGGIFFQSKRKWLHVIGFILASSTFGIAHLVSIEEWPLLFIYGGMGVLFTWSYYTTRRLYVPITLHLINNLFSTVLIGIEMVLS